MNPNNTAVKTSDRGLIEFRFLRERQFVSILHSISSWVLTLRISFLEISYVSSQWREWHSSQCNCQVRTRFRLFHMAVRSNYKHFIWRFSSITSNKKRTWTITRLIHFQKKFTQVVKSPTGNLDAILCRWSWRGANGRVSSWDYILFNSIIQDVIASTPHTAKQTFYGFTAVLSRAYTYSKTKNSSCE
jgi:hypothetical protein